ncbi:MAG: hypothetical protein M1609_02825 [Firmicutes bacterium]|nr:hypothetical protein [Bacillota bacterium]
MAKTRVVPFLVITFMAIIWGISFLSIKVVVSVLGPMTMALSRFIIATVMSTP